MKWPSTEVRDGNRCGNGGSPLQTALLLEAGSDAAALFGYCLSYGRQHPAPAALQHQSSPAKPCRPAAPAVPRSTSYRPQGCRPGREGTLQMGHRSVCVRRGSQGRATLACFTKPGGPTLASPLVSQSTARESRAESFSPQEQQTQRNLHRLLPAQCQ